METGSLPYTKNHFEITVLQTQNIKNRQTTEIKIKISFKNWKTYIFFSCPFTPLIQNTEVVQRDPKRQLNF